MSPVPRQHPVVPLQLYILPPIRQHVSHVGVAQVIGAEMPHLGQETALILVARDYVPALNAQLVSGLVEPRPPAPTLPPSWRDEHSHPPLPLVHRDKIRAMDACPLAIDRDIP